MSYPNVLLLCQENVNVHLLHVHEGRNRFRSMIIRVPPFIRLQRKRTELLGSDMRFLPFLDFLPVGTFGSLEVNTGNNWARLNPSSLLGRQWVSTLNLLDRARLTN